MSAVLDRFSRRLLWLQFSLVRKLFKPVVYGVLTGELDVHLGLGRHRVVVKDYASFAKVSNIVMRLPLLS